MTLARMELQRLKDLKIEWAVVTIQRLFRGFADRNYVTLLRVDSYIESELLQAAGGRAGELFALRNR